MAKKMLIDATHPEETRVVVVDGNRVEEFDYESINKIQIAGNIYLAKVTRVEPSLQAAFVDYGGNRHGFLAFAEIHPDYYQIPTADREALLAAEREAEEAAKAAEEAETERRGRKKGRRSRRRRGKRGAEGDTAPKQMKFTLRPTADGDETGVPTPVLTAVEGAPETFWTRPAAALNALPTLEANGASPDLSDVTEVEIRRPATEEEKAETGEDVVVETFDLPGGDGEAADAPPAQAESAGAELTATLASEVESAEDDADENGDENGDDAGEDDDEGVEEVGAEDARDEVRPRRIRMRDYKIQEVVKKRQIMLVQVVKEERGNKGAALTTYLSLAGRYCVLMPNTARGGGISRKITNAADRKRLKAVAEELEVPDGMGLIVRTAGANRTKAEIKRDYEYLLRQWTAVRDLTLKSVAPTLIYEEGSLIKRSIRDLYGKEIDSVMVEGAEGHREAKDYMRMLMPSHAKNVQLYDEATPLFIRHQVETQMADMLNPTVQLKSGGYIVIGVTEALVAIDVNSGRSTKEASIEETALKTNLEAAEEVARQLKLRDLAGLIVIDFIDMEESKNNRSVEKRLKDKLKNDRARLQIGRISGFGLLEMSRQRLRPGLLEATTTPCPHCQGAGVIRSDESLALAILRAAEEEGVRGRSKAVRILAPVAVANYLINYKRARIGQIEERYGMQVIVIGDPGMTSPDYTLERATPLTREEPVRAAAVQIESGFSEHDLDDAELEEDDVVEAEAEAEAVEDDDEAAEEPKARKPRRSRSRKSARGKSDDVVETEAEDAAGDAEAAAADGDEDGEDGASEGKRRRGRRGGRRRRKKSDEGVDAENGDPLPVIELSESPEAQETKETPEAQEAQESPAEEAVAAVETVEEPAAQEPAPAAAPDPKPQATPEPEPVLEPEPEPEPAFAGDGAQTEVQESKPTRRRTGWWNLGNRG